MKSLGVLFIALVSLASYAPPTGSNGRVHGTVVDASGKPVSGARVWVQEANRPLRGRPFSSYSDELGRFEIADLPQETYKIGASKETDDYPGESFADLSDSFFTEVVVREGGTSNARLVLHKGTRVIGRVTDFNSKQGASGASIKVIREDKPGRYVVTNAGPDGRFSSVLPSGICVRLQIVAPGYIPWNSHDGNKVPCRKLESAGTWDVDAQVEPSR